MATAQRPARARRTSTSREPAKTTRRSGSSRPVTAGETATAKPVQGKTELVRWTAVTVPVVHVRLPMLRARVPGAGAMVAQTRWAAQAVRANLPPTERLLYYGGLGLMVAVGSLEWPVAAAVGAGVWVAGRTGERRRGQAVSA